MDGKRERNRWRPGSRQGRVCVVAQSISAPLNPSRHVCRGALAVAGAMAMLVLAPAIADDTDDSFLLSFVAGDYAVVGREPDGGPAYAGTRSEEHTSELQSREKLVCRLLLEK